jgi:DNA-binding transcriptional MerR regulator
MPLGVSPARLLQTTFFIGRKLRPVPKDSEVEMIKIGAFAAMAQVSIKCLHHYDNLGLLRPIEVDRVTGYRFYAAEQLPRLHRILALKELGFSLDEIKALIDSPLSNRQLRGLLETQQSEAERRLREEQERLVRLKAHLKIMEAADDAPAYDVILKTVPSQLIASLPISYEPSDAVPLVDRFAEARSFLKNNAMPQAGPEFSLWHDQRVPDAPLQVEAAFPISGPLESNRRVQVYKTQEAQMATTIHKGRHATTYKAIGATLNWIEANNYRINGPARHVYHLCDKTDSSDSVVEVQFPVAKKKRT